MRPVLEYGSSVWDPHTKCLQEELEKVHNRAARFVTRNYTFEEGSMTGILEQLKWESLKKRRTILLYKGLKGKARISTDDLILKTRRCRNSHSKAFLLPSASIVVAKSHSAILHTRPSSPVRQVRRALYRFFGRACYLPYHFSTAA